MQQFDTTFDAVFAANNLSDYANEQNKQIYRALCAHILEVNKIHNLTAIRDVPGVITKHFADSLTIAKYIPQGASLIDVGTGGGFPTLPLAIFRPDLDITALDGTAKRIEYVKNTAKLLGLTNVTAITGRAEEFAAKSEFRETFDFATARAVASLPVLTELCLPFVKVGGVFASMKAAQGKAELESAANAISLCGGKLLSADSFSLTQDNVEFEDRVIITISKAKQTPQKYPRHYSQISKKPL